MFPVIYGLNLTGIGNGEFSHAGKTAGGGMGAALYPLGGAYSDVFRKDRLPSGTELVANCVGIIYACATLNADLLAGAHLGLFVANPKGAKKPKFVEAAERIGTRAIKSVSPKRQKFIKANSPIAAGFDDDVEIVEVVKHPLLDLFTDPDPDDNDGQPGLSGFDLRWLTQLYLETVGAAYWLVDRDANNIPRRFTLLRSQYVREVPSLDPKKGPLDHYEYGGSSGYKFDPADVIKFNIPSLRNPYLGGWAPLEAAIEKVRIGRKADASLNALLDNMGRPDAIWSPKGDAEGMAIGQREAKRMRSAMREAFGEAGRGGLLVSDMPGTIQPLQWAPQDVVELERWRQIKTDICNVFAVPDSKVERNDANLASVKTADYAHKTDAGVPRAKRWDATLNKRICRPLDPSGRLFFATDLRIPEDEELELSKQTAAVNAGAITRNEIRAGVDLPPVPWGDKPLVLNTMVPVDETTGEPEKEAPPEPQQPAPEPAKPPKKGRRRRNADPLVKLAKAMLETAQSLKALVESKDAPQRTEAPAATSESPIAAGAAAEPQVSELPAAEPAQGELLPAVRRAPDAESGSDGAALGLQPELVESTSSEPGSAAPSDDVDPGATPEKSVKAPRRIGRINADGLAGSLPEPAELTEAIKGHFRKQCDKCLAAIGTKAAPQLSTKDETGKDPAPQGATPPPPPPIPPVAEMIPWDDDARDLSALARPYLQMVGERAANEMNLNLGVTSREDIAVVDRNLSTAIDQAAMKFADSTNQTTRLKLEDAITELKQQLEEGLVEGDGLPELRNRVQGVFEDATKERAGMIARTESSRAVHTAEQISAKQSNVVKSKSWLASAEACDRCLEYAARGPIPLDANFDEDDYGPIAHAPGHPKCQCSMVYEVGDPDDNNHN